MRPRLCTCISATHPQPHASTTHVGTHPVRSATTYKRSASTALAGTHRIVGADPRARTGPFPKPRALVLPMVKFGQSKPDGLGYFDTVDSDLMHHQYRLSVLQWNPGPARRNATNIIAAAFGKFHAVILQQASDHVPHISDQFIAYTGNTDLAILLNKYTFEPDPTVVAFKADSTSKGAWGMVLLIVRGLLRRPALSGTPTVTFCSVQIHNVVAKKRDASNELLQRLHGYMKKHNVDFIGSDFNMSALSTVSRIQSFQHLVIRFCGDLVRWTSSTVSALGSSSYPRAHMSGVWIHMAATSLTMQRLASDLVTKQLTLPVFLHLRTTNLPGPSSIMRSEQAQQRRFERRHNKHDRTRRRRT